MLCVFKLSESPYMGTTIKDKLDFYQEVEGQVQAIIAGETVLIANMANVSALLFDRLEDVSWVGFYRVIKNELVLGPFQGKVACIRIPIGRGVCGTAAQTMTTQRISDVHQFEGHIACDASSNAELVLPVKILGEVVAVLDIDSTRINRFDEIDQKALEAIVQIFEASMV